MFRIFILLALFSLLWNGELQACSACKITVDGTTYFGNNEDSWRLGSQVWFVPAATGKLGCAFVGYDDNFPQGGMNEAGLAFDGLTIYRKTVTSDPSRISLGSPKAYITQLMTTCRTIADVEAFADKYARTWLRSGVFFFADSLGNYLVLEPNALVTGRQACYLMANFCPSETPESDRLKFGRYNRGQQCIANTPQPDSLLCLNVVKAMHECRAKIGDGTLHSYVCDLKKKEISFYFYHDYSRVKTFSLAGELSKGSNTYSIAELFPDNPEFQKLLRYRTPVNTPLFNIYLVGIIGIVSAGAITSWFRRRSSLLAKATLASTPFILIFLVAIILDPLPYYVPFPYKNYPFLPNITAYAPFILALLGAWWFVDVIRGKFGTAQSKVALHLLGLTAIASFIGFCGYWGLMPFIS